MQNFEPRGLHASLEKWNKGHFRGFFAGNFFIENFNVSLGIDAIYNITKMTCLCSLLEFKLYLELVLSKYVYTDIRFYIVNIKIQFYVICSPQIIFVVKLIIQDG